MYRISYVRTVLCLASFQMNLLFFTIKTVLSSGLSYIWIIKLFCSEIQFTTMLCLTRNKIIYCSTDLLHLSDWLYEDKAHSLRVQCFSGLQCKAIQIKIVTHCCLFIGSYQLIHWKQYLRIASVATINDVGFDSLISKAEITWAKELNLLSLLEGDLSRSR